MTMHDGGGHNGAYHDDDDDDEMARMLATIAMTLCARLQSVFKITIASQLPLEPSAHLHQSRLALVFVRLVGSLLWNWMCCVALAVVGLRR